MIKPILDVAMALGAPAKAELIAKIAAVPDQQAVYAADLAAATIVADPEPIALAPAEKTPQDVALDGLAHHVFNRLRGAADVVTLSDGTVLGFEDIRSQLAGGK